MLSKRVSQVYIRPFSATSRASAYIRNILSISGICKAALGHISDMPFVFFQAYIRHVITLPGHKDIRSLGRFLLVKNMSGSSISKIDRFMHCYNHNLSEILTGSWN